MTITAPTLLAPCISYTVYRIKHIVIRRCDVMCEDTDYGNSNTSY